MDVRCARIDDVPAIKRVLLPVIRAGTTYALDPGMSEAEIIAYWMGPDKFVFVAEEYGRVVGTYYLRSNQSGAGRHVSNCGFATDPAASGRGIARRMCQHSLDQARASGYLAMQFNFVVSTNHAAIHLWQSLGFDIVGRLPAAFDHPMHGYVDALIMFRRL